MVLLLTLESGINVLPWINIELGKFGKKNKHSTIYILYLYHLNRLYEVRNKAVAPAKKVKKINKRRGTFIPDSRAFTWFLKKECPSALKAVSLVYLYKVSNLDDSWFIHFLFLVYFLVQHVTCIWDKDTDQMIWWPSDIKECKGISNLNSILEIVINMGFFENRCVLKVN